MYNLTGQSSVGLSFSQPLATLSGIVFGTVNLLEALHRVAPKVRFYNAGSSECFGETGRYPANELTAFRPKSPYGIAKAASISLVTTYRESYGLFACSGILFNHESPLRPARFVTRKITSAAWRIGQGSRERLALGNLGVYRDWGWVPDYVEAMWAILQCDTADDFVIASGVSHSLEEFVAAAFAEVGLDWRDHVDLDDSLKRPAEAASDKVQGFAVADGDTWWYRIASSPWNGAYYASADAFYNNGRTSGSLHGTPFVDNAVPNC